MAYTAGLVCDLGKLVLAFVCAPFYPHHHRWCCAIAPFAPGTGGEKSVLGYHNAEAGARLLRAWRFPEYFAQAVEFQLTPAAAPAEIAPLVSQLHAARYLTFSLGSGTTEGGFSFIPDRAYLAAQGFTLEALQRATLEVRTRALHRLAQQLRPGG